MYEALRAEEQRITGPYDLVFIVYSDQLAELPSHQLQHMIKEKLEKAQVLSS
jgi:RNase P protein component